MVERGKTGILLLSVSLLGVKPVPSMLENKGNREHVLRDEGERQEEKNACCVIERAGAKGEGTATRMEK